MKKENKFLSVLLSIMIVFSLFAPSKITAEGDETGPKEENPTQQVEAGEEENKEETPAEITGEQPGDKQENPNENLIETPGEEESPSGVEEEEKKETTYSFGYISVDFIDQEDLFVQREPQLRKNSTSNEAALPDSYTVHYLNPIRNQGRYGTCWSFASMASAESTYYESTGKKTNLSELHLAFFAYHNAGVEDRLSLVTEDSLSIPYEDTGENLFQMGGNFYFVNFLLADGIGLVKEDKMPYSMLDQNKYSLKRFTDLLESEYGNYNSKCFKETEYYMVNSNEISGSDVRSIKEALYSKGAIAICYYAAGLDDEPDYYNNKTHAYYCYDNEKEANHAVTIVGWDDEYSRTNFVDAREPAIEKPLPNNNGAWLVRNSWGDYNGNGGYFWLSYEDVVLNKEDCLQLFIEPSADLRIYQYDGTVPGEERYDNINKKKAEYANVFVAQEDEEIKMVGYYAPLSNTQTTVKVYRNVKNLPEDGNLVATCTGEDTFAGYHTIKLPESIFIGKGEKFSIVISQRNIYDKDISCYVSCDFNGTWYMMKNSAEKGQSFFYENGGWTDLYSNTDGLHYTALVKAYASITKAEDNRYNYQGTSTQEYDPENPDQLTFVFKRSVLDDLTRKRFDSAKVDDGIVPKEFYSIEEGSLIFSLHKNYLEILKPGEHTLTINFTDGQSTTVRFNVLKEKEKYVPPVTGIH